MPAKLNHQLIKNVWKSTGQIDKLFTQNSELQYSCCPFTITLGAINSTEAGYKPPNSIPNDFTSFSKIFTGREAILSVWDNSFDLIERDISVKNSLGKKILKVGDVFFGNVVSDQIGITYSASNMNNAFIQEQAVKNIVINIPNQDKNFDFINNILSNMYKLYMIPEINAILNPDNSFKVDRQWYYIETASKIYNNDTKKLAFIQCTFTSLNDKLAKTGLAMNQYVHLGAVGEPVAIPSLDKFKNIILDDNYSRPRPVTHAQITFYGSVAKIAIALWGRKISNTDNKEIVMNPTQLIFPYNYQCSTFDPISFQALPETNYILTVDAKPTIDNYQQWREIIAPLYDDNATKKFDGHILTDVDKSKATNNVDAETGKYLPYWDEKFLADKALDTKIFNTFSNPYFVYFNKTNNTTRGKVDGYIPDKLKFKNFRNINAMMYFLYNSLNELPLSVRETTKIQLNTIPIFGSFFNFFIGGMNIGFKKVSNTLIPDFSVVNFFMSAELYKFYTTVLYSSAAEKNIMPLDIFRNDTIDSIPALAGTSSHMTSFTFNLTDYINLTTYNIDDNTKVETKYMDSVNLAQFNPDNNKEIFLLPKEEDFDLQPPIFKEGYYQGYYIDMLDILVMGKSDFKVTFYSIPNDYQGAVNDDFSIWSGTYQTVAKASSNVRLIRNTFLLANNNYSFKNVYDYPKIVIPPDPNKIPQIIFLDIQNLSYKDFDTNHRQSLLTEYTFIPPLKNSRLHNFYSFQEIRVSDYGYQNLDDFLIAYKELQISWNYKLEATDKDNLSVNIKNSSNPITITDIANLSVYQDDIELIFGDGGSYFRTDGTLHYGNNCSYLVKTNAANGTTVSNYEVNVTGKMKSIINKIEDTNLQPTSGHQIATFVTLWYACYLNKKNNSICFYNFVLKTNISNLFSRTNISNHEVNFRNIQIYPRI